jgi:site-specific DNA-methyltransferase (adenine-specific)
MEYMKGVPDKYFDLCITDPPYGIKLEYNSYNDSKQNTQIFIKQFMPELLRVCKRVILTTGVKLMYEYPKPDWVACWYSPAGVGVSAYGFCCWQPILIYGNDLNSKNGSIPDSFQWMGACDTDSAFHPVPKPLKLWAKIYKRWRNETDKIIFDPFLGSGTSAIIVNNLDVTEFVGCEIDKEYYDAAVKRFEVHKSQQKLF